MDDIFKPKRINLNSMERSDINYDNNSIPKLFIQKTDHIILP